MASKPSDLSYHAARVVGGSQLVSNKKVWLGVTTFNRASTCSQQIYTYLPTARDPPCLHVPIRSFYDGTLADRPTQFNPFQVQSRLSTISGNSVKPAKPGLSRLEVVVLPCAVQSSFSNPVTQPNIHFIHLSRPQAPLEPKVRQSEREHT
jgi:hypothetical protein